MSGGDIALTVRQSAEGASGGFEAAIREFRIPAPGAQGGYGPGEPGPIPPEELFLAAVGSCFLSTFSYCAAQSRLATIAAEAHLEADRLPGPISIRLVTTGPAGEEPKARRCFEFARRACTVTNALNLQVTALFEYSEGSGTAHGPSPLPAGPAEG